VEKTKEAMSDWMAEARKKVPCLLILDGLDSLLAPENEVSCGYRLCVSANIQLSSSPNPGILAAHFCQLVNDTPPGVHILVTAIASTSLHPLLSSKHIFGETHKISSPTKEVRQEVCFFVSSPDDRSSSPKSIKV
jgi:peroxin-1